MIVARARGFAAAALSVAVLALGPGFLASGAAQSPPAAGGPITFDLGRPDIWDLLPLGQPFTELATEGLVNLACGTAGGPPSLPLSGWWDYSKCPPDDETGLHEIYFEYENINLYIGLAHYETNATTFTVVAGDFPAVVSALFTDDGFLGGLRIVTDNDVADGERSRAYTLLYYLLSFFPGATFDCVDEDPEEGQTPVGPAFVKSRCVAMTADTAYSLEADFFRRAGEAGFNQRVPDRQIRTEGQFWSQTRLEQIFVGTIPDREARAAELAAFVPIPDPVAVRAMDCPGCDLRGANLARANLAGANLAGANLAGAIFHEANLAGANLSGADLTGANLNRAILVSTDLTGANLAGALLYGARLSGVMAEGADFRLTKMQTADFTSARLSGANLTQADLSGATLNGADLHGADLRGVGIIAARAQRANFEGALLDDAILYQTAFTGAVFVDAIMNRVDLRSANLQNADFTNAILTGSAFWGVIVSGINLTGANLEGVTDLPRTALPAD